MHKRNTAIEALRFLSVLQICIWHMSYPITAAGFLGVEFFFILSGFFMYQSAVIPDSPSVLSYTFCKLKKFWFKIILALIFTHMVYYQGIVIELQDNWLHPVLRFISGSLLLDSVGSFEGALNCPLWFFSTLIYGGALVYALTKYYTQLSVRIVFPIISILFFAYQFKNGAQESLESWEVIGCMPLPMVRGICEIGFGVMIGYIYFNYRDKLQHNIYIYIYNFATLISLILYGAIIANNRHFSQYALIFIPVLICSAQMPNTVLSKLFGGNCWIFLGRLSFDIFILHYPIIALFRHFLLVEAGFPLSTVALIYYIVLVPCAWLFDVIATKTSNVLFYSAVKRTS